ncbi:MAG: energy transducer TonB [Candidatus Manganitrophus sp.]|nr:energy transducer TonB [Candidatus Manganitrophus sp.]
MVGDAFPGGIAGAGGGQAGPRFVIPSAGRSNPKPRYPERARAEGREGTALLKVTVLATGKVGEALIEHSSGHADLDRSAVEAVMKWTFLPARRGRVRWSPRSASR